MNKFLKIFIICLITIISFIFLINFFQVDKKILMKLYPNKYSSFVEKYSDLYGVNKETIFAIIKNESNFENEVSSHKGAKGLMQLMETTANEVAINLNLEEVDLLDAQTNIQLGTKYFSILYKKYKSVELALAAYNAGSGNVDKWIEQGIISNTGENIENIPYKETNMYVRKVMHTMEIYKLLYN